MFDRNRFKLARMQVDVSYHAAFTYWSLKGVIAERWAHGPLLGQFADLGNQVNLTPAVGSEPAANGIMAYYGISQSGFNSEPAVDADPSHNSLQSEAIGWISDVIDVLQPQRVTRVLVNLFGIYPVPDIDRASELLRERFYKDNELSQALLPPRAYAAFHSAAECFLVSDDGTEHLSVVVGAVGPQHKGVFFATDNPERDERWWMGVRVTASLWREEEGISDPAAETERLLLRTREDLMRVGTRALNTIV